MKHSRWRWVLGAVAVLLLVGAAAGLNRAKDTSAGTGYSAHELCTRTLVSGQSMDLVRTRYVEPKVAPLPMIWQLYTGSDAVTVKTWLPTLEHPRTAILAWTGRRSARNRSCRRPIWWATHARGRSVKRTRRARSQASPCAR
jgi:hypothetical protein